MLLFLAHTVHMDIAVKNCINASLPSNLRPTTRECVPLVTRGHFRSRDKNGGDTIRSAVVENPWYAQTERLCVFLRCGNRDFWLFCSCKLDLDPMIFTYELDRISSRCTEGPKMNFLRQGFLKLSWYNRQRDRRTDIYALWYATKNYIPRCFAGGQILTGGA